jgi:hypothetical protein
MSKQNVSTSLKRALWTAYNFRCFYDEQELGWDELTIDHIIPEHLADKPVELALVLKQMGLEAGWSLNPRRTWFLRGVAIMPAKVRCCRRRTS